MWSSRSTPTTNARLSVVVRGEARLLEENEAHRADTTRLRSWLPTHKYNVVEIEPIEITGRRFTVARPWLHMRLDG
jgi:hypothetical protein